MEEQRLLNSGAYGEVREMYDTELGRIEEAARREGEQTALQHALMAVLFSRFPTAPGDIRQEIETLRDPEVLDGLIRRVATATSLEDAWPPRGH